MPCIVKYRPSLCIVCCGVGSGGSAGIVVYCIVCSVCIVFVLCVHEHVCVCVIIMGSPQYVIYVALFFIARRPVLYSVYICVLLAMCYLVL